MVIHMLCYNIHCDLSKIQIGSHTSGCSDTCFLHNLLHKLYRHFFCSEMIKLQIVCHINKTLIDTVHMDIFF